jgi:NAD(P)-dependent dehydrogenase (short-subunit alcohol dehydrogenase family)
VEPTKDHAVTKADNKGVSLRGKRALVTGATGGLGLETARQLAERGADVLLAGRNRAKGDRALADLSGLPGTVSFEMLDLADLASVRDTGERLADSGPIHILVNNAGVMAPRDRELTKDGFELQFGTNHLGHFALTGRLLPALRAGKARVVTVSSGAAYMGKIHFDDLRADRKYDAWRTYGQSKLANLLFARALQRRSDESGWGLLSVAAHPGFARTDLIANGPGSSGLSARAAVWFGKLFSQSAADGAHPTVRAATGNDVRPDDYFGPDGFMNFKGDPTRVRLPKQALDDSVGERLWSVSEDLTGVVYADPIIA